MTTRFERFFKGERRRAPRIADDLTVAIHVDGLADPIEGVARDLSMGGICVATRIAFAHANTMRIAVQAASKAVLLESKRLWQQYEPGEKVVLTGFSFAALSENDRKTIAELLSASVQRISEILRSSRLPELGPADVMAIAEEVRFRCIRSGHVVYGCDAQDHHAGSLYIVEEGRISLHLASDESQNRAIAQIQEGDLFGGIDAGAGASMREVAIAECEAYLFEIGRSGFDHLRRHRPELALELASAAFRAARTRLSSALLEAAEPRQAGTAARAAVEANQPL
jgi:CRP-like cAMP-binding protein